MHRRTFFKALADVAVVAPIAPKLVEAPEWIGYWVPFSAIPVKAVTMYPSTNVYSAFQLSRTASEMWPANAIAIINTNAEHVELP